MVRMKNQAGRAGKLPLAMVAGWLVGLGSTLLLSSALTQLILSETLLESAAGTGAMMILAVSAAADALVSALMAKSRWLPVCLGAGGMYYLTMLALGMMLFDGAFLGAGTGLIVTVGASAAVGAIALRGGKRTSGKRKFRHYG